MFGRGGVKANAGSQHCSYDVQKLSARVSFSSCNSGYIFRVIKTSGRFVMNRPESKQLADNSPWIQQRQSQAQNPVFTCNQGSACSLFQAVAAGLPQPLTRG